MDNKNNLKKQLYGSLAVIVLLVIMLTVTTYALVSSFVKVEENHFQMGTVDISLNEGKKIFDGEDFLLEPGSSVKEDFTIKNESSVEVYYRLYLENVSGDLSDALIFQIYEGDALIYSCSAKDFNIENPCIGADSLNVGETKDLSLVVKMTEESGNQFQNGYMAFDITADAVQVRNNPDMMFE